jgi:outer membrane protein assembly factor BamB
VVVVARSKAKSIAILDAANGKLLWEIKGTDKFWTPLVNDELWHSNHKYEIRTGQVKGTLPTSLDGGAIMCTPSAVVGQYVTASRGCAYVDLYPSSEGGTQKGSKRISFAAARGGCIQGATPANGLFYTGQNFCRCSPGQVPGFIAFGPGGKPLEQSDFEQTRPLEKGPAYARPAGPAGPDDWPMHRHDAERSGSAKTAIPAKLKELWQSAATHPAEGPLASAWQARLASCLSSPVVAGGMAYVAATDAGQVIALNAATGKEAWRVTVGGRVDTPPTIHNGRCLFGAHDGWIYALDPKNGQLAWRSRMAPDERRMVAFGQVESVWPAIGSVLVHQGIAYASAGRSTEADGGLAVCAFNPGTGAQKWARQIGPGPVRQNDLLVWRDGKINLHHLQLDPQTGAINTGGTKDENLEGLIDGSWTRMGTRRSGNQKLGRATAEIFAWDTQTVFGYESKSRSYFAMAYTNCMANVTNKLTAKDYLWKVTLPADHQAEAMALGENGLVLAGRIVQPKTQAVTGFLWTTARDNGQKNSEYPLDTAPVYDGLALTAGRVYLTLQNGKVACFTGE